MQSVTDEKLDEQLREQQTSPEVRRPAADSLPVDRVPSARWGRTWMLASLLFLLLMGGWEMFWRAQGFRPSLNDDAALWALSRRAAAAKGTDALVFVGASRIQLDLNTAVVAEMTGKSPVVLAIDGESPIPVLDDLANDEAFRGTIICELPEHTLFFRRDSRELKHSVASQWVKAYKERPFSADFERQAESLIEESFVFRLPDLALRNVIGNLRLGRLPMRPYLNIKPDRSRDADYTKIDIAEHRRRREELAERGYGAEFPLDIFLQGAQEMESLVSRIEARGGRVIFVRFPTTGRHWELDEAKLPKAKYWDAFAARTAAETVHFKDHPSLSAFECPDSSHLDYRQAIPFTRALMEILYDDRAKQ